jgi:flagellar biosynthesis activator protein FlaF
MHSAAQAYGKVARQVATSRELEANLLLKAAAQLQALCAGWNERRQAELHDALLFNRKLWTIFMTSVTSEGNLLPAEVRQNIANIGLFVMKQTVATSGAPHPDKLRPLININREVAAGLLARA